MSKKGSFDLGSIAPATACNTPHEFELLHPQTEKPLGIYWSVYGKDSDAAREYKRDRDNENLRKAQQAERRGKKAELLTIESLEGKTIEYLTLCSTGWRSDDGNVLNFKGEMLEFNHNNVIRVLSDKDMWWVREQLDIAINDLGNFMKT